LRSRGGAIGVEIVLRAGAAAVVTVLDWQDKPVAGANVGAQPSQQGSGRGGRGGGGYRPGATTQTNAKGTIRLGGLDPAVAYALSVSPPNDRDDLLGTTLDPWTPRDETTKLARGFVVRGQVRDLQGKPVPG